MAGGPRAERENEENETNTDRGRKRGDEKTRAK